MLQTNASGRRRHLDPLAGDRLHLEPAGRVVAAQDRQEAVVAMRAGAQLPRLGRRVGLRVVDDAQRRRELVEAVLEPVRRMAERLRDHAAQPPRERDASPAGR